LAPDEYYNAPYPMNSDMSAFPPYTPVGMCYVPMQRIKTVYEPEIAFRQGTLFPDLDKPWLDGRGYAK
jgi:hypothetical protein